jgi:hypothetical protein
MKTEYMNDLPLPNDLPQEVDRWVAKCIAATYSLSTHLQTQIYYADADLYPYVYVILSYF